MIFEFITNTECNWNCEYCTFGRVPNHRMDLDVLDRHSYIFDIMDKIRYYMDIESICEGGEIGFMSNSVLEALFKKINSNVIINTNGKFFESDRKCLYQYIDKVYFHIAPDADTLFKVQPPLVPLEVIYGLVHDDPVQAQKFIKYNRHINIGYNEYEFINILPKEKKAYDLHRKACWNTNPFTVIDLSREVLLPCAARGAHITIPLTEQNLIGVLTDYVPSVQVNDMCQSCYRMCMCTDWEDTVKRKAFLKKIL